MSYCPELCSFSHRQSFIQQVWNFVCRCKLCQLDMADDNTTRDKLMHGEWDKAKANGVRGMLVFKRKLEKTYAADRVLRPDMAKVNWTLAQNEALPKLQRFNVSRSHPYNVMYSIGSPKLITTQYVRETMVNAGWTLATAAQMKNGGSVLLGYSSEIFRNFSDLLILAMTIARSMTDEHMVSELIQ